MAAAEVLQDSGSLFGDDALSQSAIEGYKLLRQEFPGSPSRMEALFNIARIYQDDLDDAAQAKSAYEEFLKRYPSHELVLDAKDSLKELAKGRRSAHDKTEVAKSKPTEKPAPVAKADVPPLPTPDAQPASVM